MAGCKINRLILFNGKEVSLADFLKTAPQEEFKGVSVKTKQSERVFYTYAKNVIMKSHHQRVRVVFSYENKIEGGAKVLVTNRLAWDMKLSWKCICYEGILTFSIGILSECVA